MMISMFCLQVCSTKSSWVVDDSESGYTVSDFKGTVWLYYRRYSSCKFSADTLLIAKHADFYLCGSCQLFWKTHAEYCQ
jgi:ribosomal protein S27AE